MARRKPHRLKIEFDFVRGLALAGLPNRDDCGLSEFIDSRVLDVYVYDMRMDDPRLFMGTWLQADKGHDAYLQPIFCPVCSRPLELEEWTLPLWVVNDETIWGLIWLGYCTRLGIDAEKYRWRDTDWYPDEMGAIDDADLVSP